MKMNSLRVLLFYCLCWFIGLFPVGKAHSQSIIDGTWHSSFQVMGKPMLLDMQIQSPEEKVNYLFDPAKPEQQMELSNFSWKNDSLSFQWTRGGLSYKGNYDPDSNTISGTMKQSGLSWVVTFRRELQQLVVPDRPQTPVAPYPYRSQEVSYFNKEDSTEIFATLTYPADPTGNYPVVILASGSGAQDRNCSLLGHEPFLVLADQFARSGIATLRFDDRGAGQSKANFYQASLTDFGNDVAAAVSFVSTQLELKGHAIGLLGHSEGGMHILLAQKKMPKQVDFMIFLCSVGVIGKEVLVQQQYDVPLKAGSDEQTAKWNRDVYAGISDIVLRQKDFQKAGEELGIFLREQFKNAPQGAVDGMTEMQFVMTNTFFLNNSWGRQFLAFDPAVYLKKYKGPGLAVVGGKDLQVAAEANLAVFRKALAKNTGFEYVLYPGINHLMQTCTTCTVTEYGDLTQTIDPAVIATVIDYIQRQNK